MQQTSAFLALLVLLSACSSGAKLEPTQPSVLQPYQTASPTKSATPIPLLTQAILPSPTVFIYVVVQGDTLTRIAARFGISLQALTAANPGIQATTLEVGTKLTIPLGGTHSGEPTPTPVPLNIQQVHCWPETNGGWWCFALVQDQYTETLENLSAQFSLLSSSGQELTSQVAYASLDILLSGEAMPLAVYFPPPIAAGAVPRVEMLTSFRLLPNDPRYLSCAVQNTLVSVDWSGRSAQLSGQVVLTNSNGTATSLWVLGVAYDTAGEVVGLRRWDASTPLEAGKSLPFNFTVSSVGPAIDHVDFLVEARPSPPTPTSSPGSH